ncbi:MAG TPA: endonuclease/exonuclease/phosphatase family protein [Chitinophagaceae bacterium]
MAKGFFRRFTRRFFLIANIIFCAAFLLACLVPLLNPKTWWFMGFFGLLLPYLALALVLWVLFWWAVKPAFSLLPIITLLVGYKQIGVLVALNKPNEFVQQKAPGTIRIANWNVRSFVGISGNKEKRRQSRGEIADLLKRTGADILCLQEFNHSYARANADNLSLFSPEYPYRYFARDFGRDHGNYASGCIIFSKFPIIDSGKVKYPGQYAESLIYADIVTGADTIRIFTTHLLSFRFNKDDYEGMDRMKEDPETIAASRTLIRKMKHAFTRRGEQSDIAKAEISRSPYPSVLTGDFNDVPNSYTYFTLKGVRKDAFLQKGLGIGRSYISLAPTLRIDYILADRSFDVLQFDMIDEDLSDHLLLVSDLKLKK